MKDVIQESQSISFEAAIAQTQTLLDQIAANELTAPKLEGAIATLVSSENGARGFFVTYLTDERAIADQITPELIRALQSSPEIVAELLVKNLAMSSAMIVHHRRNHDELNAQGSERVRTRTAKLVQTLVLPILHQKAQRLVESAATGTGDYQAFLDRWGYDSEQRQVIQQAFQQLFTQ
jgi:hypothetical protein